MIGWVIVEIYAIGHSTRPLDDFVELLKAHGITLLADIRTIPRSRHNPQFNRESLEQELPKMEIQYRQAFDAYRIGFFPGAKQVDAMTVRFEADSYFEVMRFMLFVA